MRGFLVQMTTRRSFPSPVEILCGHYRWSVLQLPDQQLEALSTSVVILGNISSFKLPPHCVKFLLPAAVAKPAHQSRTQICMPMKKSLVNFQRESPPLTVTLTLSTSSRRSRKVKEIHDQVLCGIGTSPSPPSG
jgi:hypothetical protein